MATATGEKPKSSKRPRTTVQNGSSHPEPLPALRVIDPSSSSPRPSVRLGSRTLLQELLHPLSAHDFLHNSFRKQAVHIRSTSGSSTSKDKKNIEKSSNRFQPIIEDGMYNLRVLDLLQETSSDNIFVWLAVPNEASEKNNTDNNQKLPRIHSMEVPDAQSAYALHRAGGHALYCRAPPSVEQPLVSGMLRDTGLGCGQYDPSGESMTTLGRGEVEMFLSAKPGGTTDWHTDFQENFTLQLSGVKRWTLQQGTVTHPLRGCTPHYQAPDVVESQLKAAHLAAPGFVFDQPDPAKGNSIGPPCTAILVPGDALYFPAGMFHRVETIEPGVSINVSLMATNYATLTCQALQHILLQRDEWRQSIVHGNMENAVEHLQRLLQDELPKVVQDLVQQQGGARAILPPVLLQPPNFQPSSNENDEVELEDEEEEEGMVDENIEEEEPVVDVNDRRFVEEEDEFIETWTFDFPVTIGSSLSPDCQLLQLERDVWKTHQLVCNPLASLIRMDEVTRYYAPAKSSTTINDNGDGGRQATTPDDDVKHLYVLNVNYAGVESHESYVRVVLRDHPDESLLEDLYQSIKTQKQTSPTQPVVLENALVAEIHSKCPSLMWCLVYYGLLVMVKC